VPAGGDAPYVLVADDDDSLRLLCRVNLELDGYEVGEAVSADDVERELAEHDVALVLLDVHLGADDGLAIARKMRSEDGGTRIALFSGSASLFTPDEAALADAVIPKPFSLESLIATVRSLAAR